MSENRDNGGPAFPVEVDSTQPNGRQTGPTVFQAYGMSLRDYFAVHASDADLKAQADILREDQRKQYGAAILPDNWTALARYIDITKPDDHENYGPQWHVVMAVLLHAALTTGAAIDAAIAAKGETS